MDMRQYIGRVTHQHRHVLQRILWSHGDMAAPALIGKQSHLVLLAHARSQHDGAIHKGVVGRAVGKPYGTKRHRQSQTHLISVRPFTGHRNIAIGRYHRLRLTVHGQRHPRSVRPFRHTELHREFFCFLRGNTQGRGFFSRERGLLLHRHLAPLQHRRNEQVYIQLFLPLVCINHLAVTCMILHARTHTTPKTCLRLGIYPVMPRTHGREIHEATLDGIYGGQDVVEHRPLIEVHVTRVAARLIKHLGQTQHVVGVAGFRSLFARHHAGKVVRRMEMLAHTVAADGNAAVFHHGFPKETRRIIPSLIAFQIRNTLVTNDLRDLRVGVFARQLVFVLQ